MPRGFTVASLLVEGCDLAARVLILESDIARASVAHDTAVHPPAAAFDSLTASQRRIESRLFMPANPNWEGNVNWLNRISRNPNLAPGLKL